MASEQPSGSEMPPTQGFAKRRPDWELPQLHGDLEVADDGSLFALKGRLPCPKCTKSRSFYCYDCLVPLTETPPVALPFQFSIITHKDERPSMNTGVHAAILAPGAVQLHDIDHCPEFDKSRAVVLFPSDDALEACDVEPDSIDRAFIIDSKWAKARTLTQHPALAGVRRVKLSNSARSAFWRFHTKGVADEGVCTIEAMLFFLNSLAEQGKLSAPAYKQPHCFDNLLWYFVHQHKVVQQAAARKMQKLTEAGEGHAGRARTTPLSPHAPPSHRPRARRGRGAGGGGGRGRDGRAQGGEEEGGEGQEPEAGQAARAGWAGAGGRGGGGRGAGARGGAGGG
ncbi:hypothetical protein FOA52_001910 [Chlamydomonas sp. UWO 241]|nr:hypothetical protein FOA52_001910 [Chlamydomonas sp. UWO 241]